VITTVGGVVSAESALRSCLARCDFFVFEVRTTRFNVCVFEVRTTRCNLCVFAALEAGTIRATSRIASSKVNAT
jgi:hypothetical protein